MSANYGFFGLSDTSGITGYNSNTSLEKEILTVLIWELWRTGIMAASHQTDGKPVPGTLGGSKPLVFITFYQLLSPHIKRIFSHMIQLVLAH